MNLTIRSGNRSGSKSGKIKNGKGEIETSRFVNVNIWLMILLGLNTQDLINLSKINKYMKKIVDVPLRAISLSDVSYIYKAILNGKTSIVDLAIQKRFNFYQNRHLTRIISKKLDVNTQRRIDRYLLDVSKEKRTISNIMTIRIDSAFLNVDKSVVDYLLNKSETFLYWNFLDNYLRHGSPDELTRFLNFADKSIKDFSIFFYRHIKKFLVVACREDNVDVVNFLSDHHPLDNDLVHVICDNGYTKSLEKYLDKIDSVSFCENVNVQQYSPQILDVFRKDGRVRRSSRTDSIVGKKLLSTLYG